MVDFWSQLRSVHACQCCAGLRVSMCHLNLVRIDVCTVTVGSGKLLVFLCCSASAVLTPMPSVWKASSAAETITSGPV